MTISVWRYSHLALAVSSSLLLILAAVTGIILSFEPISQKLLPYRTPGFNQITLAESLPAIRKTYPGITELSVDANQFVQLKGSAQGKKLLVYADGRNGKILGIPSKQSEFFQWVTGLHRSLFLHEIGRFFIGLTSFLLFLITVSGTILIIQRQRGAKRFFTKIVKDNWTQYYHVVLGRWSIIPIVIIALTGTYLSLNKFGFFASKNSTPKIDFDAIKSAPVKNPAEFFIFKQTKLAEVQTIEFPFSEDAEDYYTLKLKDREITVNQITGDILSEVEYPITQLISNLSLNLHTGRASALWAVVLAIASANILFFIYSGFAITLKRMKNRIINKYPVKEAQVVILVGSENGSTFSFAQAIHQQLIQQGKKSFIAELNQYTSFPQAEQLIVMTATYGLGDAPTNSSKFVSLLQENPQQQRVPYSVLGFGSKSYPDFCKFSFEVNQLISKQDWAVPLIDIHTVNDKSPDDFALWAEAWSQQSGIAISVSSDFHQQKTKELETLTVTEKLINQQLKDTFIIRFQPQKKSRITSGDLLAIYPANDYRERLYSIGLIKNEIQLSVRLHPNGLGSGFLHELKSGESLQARLVNNEHFHFPKKAPEVIMISNGTGIAPFLGMISQNLQKTSCRLYCGFRENASFSMYKSFLDENIANQKLKNFQVTFSRENEKQYVSDLIARDADLVINALQKGGVLMLCGSLSMQKDVLSLLENICQNKTSNSISFYQSHGQILMDCY